MLIIQGLNKAKIYKRNKQAYRVSKQGSNTSIGGYKYSKLNNL